MYKNKCKQEVWHDAWHHGTCSRSAIKGGYCKVHHPESVAIREKKKEERYQKKLDASPFAKIGRLEKVLRLALDALERTRPPKDGYTDSVCAKIKKVLKP